MTTTINGLTAQQWVGHCIQVARSTQKMINDYLRADRADALSPVTLKNGKRALTVDIYAEKNCIQYFAGMVDRALVVGEERMRQDLSENHKGRVCILVDMVDGTDLLEMDIPMWCTAMVVFHPEKKIILGSVVALATGEIYSANCDDADTMVERPIFASDNGIRLAPMSSIVGGPSKESSLMNATICFYGQKASRMKSVFDIATLRNKLIEVANKKGSNLRIHTLAGNPMMVKMIDRPRDESGEIVGRGIDMVFDLEGQQPHDVIPGAYIALKAGASLFDSNGKAINIEDLCKLLLDPSKPFSYVLSSTPILGNELINALR